MSQIATDIGTQLRLARETRGLTLRDIAAVTKISMISLTAIERNDFARLPGGVFRKAYLRAFAAEVGLSGDDIARQYRATFEPDPPMARAAPGKVAWNDGIRFAPRPAVIAAAAVAVIAICAMLLFPRDQAANDVTVSPTFGGEEAGVPVKTPQPVDRAEGQVAAAAPTPLRVEIRTSELCWVSAAADGDRAVYRLMQPGESALVEARGAITLRVGDAGAVAYSINGAAGKSLGDDGEAVTVSITADNFEALVADAEAPRDAQETNR